MNSDFFLAGLNGFLLGASLIIAIGPQNAFVLRQGLKREYVFIICLICSLSDAALIIAGVAGLGTLIQQSRTWLMIVTACGALFLFFYGGRAFFRAMHANTMQPAKQHYGQLAKIIGVAFALTFLNPHVYLDTVLLLGSLSARYQGSQQIAYAMGAAAASFAWFFALGYGARLLIPVFADPRAWRALDIGIGIIMWLIATRLILDIL